MNSPLPFVECSEPTCLNAENRFGQRLCRGCQAPLVYRYLWMVGTGADRVSIGTVIDDRYIVMSPRVCLDTQPGQSPRERSDVVEAALPYLQLLSHHLHIPQIYAICDVSFSRTPLLLLENVPIDPAGQPYASITSVWEKTTATRQVYWLWQILQLWTPLHELGFARSLLVPSNLRVDGWRIRLQELYADDNSVAPTLSDLADLWLEWLGGAQLPVGQPLREVCLLMREAGIPQGIPATTQRSTTLQLEAPTDTIAVVPPKVIQRLNRILLEQASQLPLTLKIAGATSTGPQRTHNEDTCYPNTLGNADPNQPDDLLLMPRLAIVCDGIGGHAGGEVASQLTLRSLKLQICALLTEVAEQAELLPPDVITQQLEAMIRVANNLIAAQNDSQEREARQRMCTTLAMALQLPQQVLSPAGINNTHELYLAHVGDSRAYWLTLRGCHLLTVDDDIAAREVRAGRSLYRPAQSRSDAGALTQAIGTKAGEFLRPTVQRFVVEEDGILLLCSDGLSDRGWVEKMWEHSTKLVLREKMSLEAAVRSWIELANQKNGQDNASIVMLHCRTASSSLHLFEPETLVDDPDLSEMSDASKALLYGEETPIAAPASAPSQSTTKPRRVWLLAIAIAVAFFLAGGAGIAVWRALNPAGFQQMLDRVTEGD